MFGLKDPIVLYDATIWENYTFSSLFSTSNLKVETNSIAPSLWAAIQTSATQPCSLWLFNIDIIYSAGYSCVLKSILKNYYRILSLNNVR